MFFRRNTSVDILNAQMTAFSGMIRAATGGGMVDRAKPFDVFGNPHEPDGVGYCPCWQCPKRLRLDPLGIDEDVWWTPKPQPEFTWRERRKYGLPELQYTRPAIPVVASKVAYGEFFEKRERL